jgi:anaerobic magnesium-protoporphyrin IX monomethyl ester cyclase
MIVKVGLIDPAGLNFGLNSGLAYLSAILHQKGHEVRVIDLNKRKDNFLERIKSIKGFDIIGLSVGSFTLQNSLKIVKNLSKGKSLLVAGGPYITLDGVNFLKDNSVFDVGVIGEGESTIIDLCEEKSLANIEGIIYRDSLDIKVNKRRQFLKNLDSLPFPNYDFFDSMNGTIIGDYHILTSRGCPYPCNYCSVGSIIGKQWRARSPKNVIEELICAKEKYKIVRFQVVDDNFSFSIKRAKDICQLLIDEKIGLEWKCANGVRADKLDEELLKLMKASGCKSISIGIESCSQEVFDKINKKEKLETIFETISTAKKAGLEVTGNFIVGLPGSTYDLDRISLQRAKSLKLNMGFANLFLPFPDTTFWDMMSHDPEVRFLKHWNEGVGEGASPVIVFETPNYTKNEKLKMYSLFNIGLKNYAILARKSKSIPQNILSRLKAIAIYDPQRLPISLVELVRLWARVEK